MALSGCGQLLNAQVGSPQTEEAKNMGQTVFVEITKADKNIDYKDFQEILLDAQSRVTEEGYTWEDNLLYIYSAGTYVLRGNLDGGVQVRVYDDELVHLIFENVEIKNDDGPAIYVEEADKVIITLAEGSENILSDGAEYAGDKEACIFSNTDLTINGPGMLYVYGYYHDAIRSKDCIKLVETSVSVRSKNNGVRGNDGVIIQDSQVQVESEGTGIMSKSGKNFVVIEGGSCQVTAGEHAVSAGCYVSISGCETSLYSVMEAVQCDGIKEID